MTAVYVSTGVYWASGLSSDCWEIVVAGPELEQQSQINRREIVHAMSCIGDGRRACSNVLESLSRRAWRMEKVEAKCNEFQDALFPSLAPSRVEPALASR